MRRWIIVFAAMSYILVSLITAPALAQSGQNQTKDSKKQTLNFEDELVEGKADKPELFYLFQKKNFNYKRLIRLRDNFLPEMRKTSEDIQRTRGNN
jgi:hypothetical protein